MKKWKFPIIAFLSFFLLNTTLILKPPLLPPTNPCLELPDEYLNYQDIELPPYIGNIPNLDVFDNTPANNFITNEAATLGRVLFYDKNMSANNTISCASCHLQEFGFTDTLQLSQGFEGGSTGRNSMNLSHAKYYEPASFFWDQRAATLEDQTLMPIQDLVEMGMDLDDLILKLEATDYYPDLFEDAFGSNILTVDRISRALAQFIRSMESYGSKYDEGRATIVGPGQGGLAPFRLDFPNFTSQENLGKSIFYDPEIGNCASCHTPDLFVAPGPRNNGLDVVYDDNGVGAVTGNLQEYGLFKVPSLRNVELSGPYMHDGRFETLEEVVEHYNSGVQNHPNLGPQLRVAGPNSPPKVLNLSEDEKMALVAFLKTLTDHNFLSDDRWSDPFCEITSTHVIEKNKFQVYPNPFTQGTQVDFVNPNAVQYNLRIFDYQGKVLWEVTTIDNSYYIQNDFLLPGIYFLQIDNDNSKGIEKIVVQ